MTFLHQHSRSIEVALALILFCFGAYALRSRKAEVPLHIWSLTVRRDAQPFWYWFCVILYFAAAVNFLYLACTKMSGAW
jgi:hypothetical protein